MHGAVQGLEDVAGPARNSELLAEGHHPGRVPSFLPPPQQVLRVGEKVYQKLRPQHTRRHHR